MPNIQIASKQIGADKPAFIIAEAGVNHNGNIDLAMKLVRAARDAGADAIKFQTFKSELLVTPDASMAKYQIDNSGKQETQYEMLKKLELSEEDHFKLKDYCQSQGIIFLSTPFDYSSLDLLLRLDVPAFKVGSSDADNIPFLVRLAKTNKPLIISSGMSSLQELEESIEVIRPINQQLIVLQCTTAYPCPPKQVNLKAIARMREKLKTLIGFSDHTEGSTAAIMSTILGAVVVEKHMTLDRKMPGPDHLASMEPREFSKMIQAIRNSEKLGHAARLAELTSYPLAEEYLGSAEKSVLAGVKESGVIEVAKKSIIAACTIEPGTVISEEMLIIKRPGSGIRPKDFFKVVGKTAGRKIQKDQVIEWDWLA